MSSRDPHLAEGDVRFEPRSALTPGGDGLDAIRGIVAGARAHLAPGGALVVEHGYDQADAVRALFAAAGLPTSSLRAISREFRASSQDVRAERAPVARQELAGGTATPSFVAHGTSAGMIVGIERDAVRLLLAPPPCRPRRAAARDRRRAAASNRARHARR